MMLSVTTVQNWKFRISPHADWKQNPAEKPDRAGGQNQTTASAVALCEISP